MAEILGSVAAEETKVLNQLLQRQKLAIQCGKSATAGQPQAAEGKNECNQQRKRGRKPFTKFIVSGPVANNADDAIQHLPLVLAANRRRSIHGP